MKRILISLFALMLALAVGMTAIAETTATETTTDTTAAATTDTTTALQEAVTAYNAARQANQMTDFETELKAMVAAGSLTQEQADLLLTYAKETSALRNGVCPSCGYQFQTATDNGHGKNFNKGNRGGKNSTADTTTALGAAEAAYEAAKDSTALTDYEAELKAMVAAGSLTQEQADLLLANAKEAQSLANGTCPQCGYKFQTVTSITTGNGMNGGKGHGGRH